MSYDPQKQSYISVKLGFSRSFGIVLSLDFGSYELVGFHLKLYVIVPTDIPFV